MKVVGIIPARYASKRFPGKPLVDIAGKTMIQRVYEQSKKSINDVYVATDDKRIQKAVLEFGGQVIMTSKKHNSGTDRIAEAIDIINKLEDTNFDIIVNIQGDEPFIYPEQIDSVIKCFNNKQTQIATLAKHINNSDDIFNENKPKVILNKNKEAINFSRSPIPYYRGKKRHEWVTSHKYYKHIGLYAYRLDILKEITKLKESSLEIAESLEQLRWIENGYKIVVEETEFESIGIDTPKDLKKIFDTGIL